MRYPRGKSWNWYRRALKRGGIDGTLWLESRRAKRGMVKELGNLIYGPQGMLDPKDFTGFAVLSN